MLQFRVLNRIRIFNKQLPLINVDTLYCIIYYSEFMIWMNEIQFSHFEYSCVCHLLFLTCFTWHSNTKPSLIKCYNYFVLYYNYYIWHATNTVTVPKNRLHKCRGIENNKYTTPKTIKYTHLIMWTLKESKRWTTARPRVHTVCVYTIITEISTHVVIYSLKAGVPNTWGRGCRGAGLLQEV